MRFPFPKSGSSGQGSETFVESQGWMYPVGGSALLESEKALDRLRRTEAGLHPDAVVEPDVVVQAGLDDRAGAGRGAAALRKHLACGVRQLVVRDDPSHHAPFQRFLCGQSAAGEHSVAGTDRPDQARQHVAVVRLAIPR